MGLKLSTVSKELAAIVGKENVSTQAFNVPEYCESHVARNVFGMGLRAPSIVVARPMDVDALSAVMRYAYRAGTPVFVRGGGTGYSGGHVPTLQGIALELTGLDRVLDVDEVGGFVTCQAGITVKNLNLQLVRRGMWWTHDPGSREWATVGGAISTLGTGAFSTKFGPGPETVVSMKIVTSEGEIVTVGGTNVRHDGATYQLLDTITSGEGTLAIIAEVTLKIQPVPRRRAVTIALHQSFEDVVASCRALLEAGLHPESIMFEDMARFRLESLEPVLGPRSRHLRVLELGAYSAAAIYSYSGDGEVVDFCRRKTERLARKHGGKVVRDSTVIRAYWTSKTEMPSWSDEMGESRAHSYVPAIPLDKVPEFHRLYGELAGKRSLEVLGARYYILLPSRDVIASPTIKFDDGDAGARREYEEFCVEFAQKTVELRGTPSASLGVGMRFVDVVERLTEPAQLELMRRIRSAFDPKGILNPGKKIGPCAPKKNLPPKPASRRKRARSARSA